MSLINWILFLLLTALSLGSAGHALLCKSDSRSALGWVSVCLLFPLAGPVLYILFGINRVKRSASRMRKKIHPPASADNLALFQDGVVINPAILHHSFRQLEIIGRTILGIPLVGGNCVEALHNGDEAYPLMLEAIAQAKKSIYLSTYIFATDSVGQLFIDALARATHRGVQVCVLIDGLGEKYSWPPASKLLKRKQVPTALFTPPKFFPPQVYVNLRNHRKILIVDDHLAFTGGMNISQKNMLDTKPVSPITDLHFIVRGPIIEQLRDTFVEDWLFATKEPLTLPSMVTEPAGDCLCRAVIDGPDQDETLKTLLTGIISAAQTSIKIMTPYFLPQRSLLSALRSASYRGVAVQIILPRRNNLPFVHWATTHILEELLDAGMTIAYQPAPFAHSKLLLVDDCYVHLGSANFDYRSLRLNFELTLEVFDQCLAETLNRHFDSIMARSRPLTHRELRKRTLAARLRDAFFWLFSPYL